MARIILILILLIVIARIFWRVFDGMVEGFSGRQPKRPPARTSVKLVRDPMCGTHVAPGTALSLTAGGTTQYFCSEECRKNYAKKASA